MPIADGNISVAICCFRDAASFFAQGTKRMNALIRDLTCAGCGCICEDISVHIAKGVIAEVEGACVLCKEQLLGQTAGEAEPPKIAEAIEILAEARSPLIYGLAGSTVETQRAAVALAETLGATIDFALPDFHRSSLQAMQSVGISTCTLGEIRQRADVIIFWGADPVGTHPRLFERFIDPVGQFVASRRYVVSVGRQPPNHPADEFVQIDPADNLAALSTLRAAVAGIELSGAASYSEQLRELGQRLVNAEYCVIFFGPDINGVAEIESLFRLVRQLNARSRCAAIALGGTQCENVLSWQTGYPCCVNFALGYPRYEPDRYSANSVLERRETDAVVLVGSEGISQLSPEAQKQIVNLPVVLLEFPGCRTPWLPLVQIVTARAGVHYDGTVFRMDGVPIKLRAVLDSPLPTPAAILTDIQQGVCASCV
jgi:formylmethanofuran dehydrogenase subunit B